MAELDKIKEGIGAAMALNECGDGLEKRHMEILTKALGGELYSAMGLMGKSGKGMEAVAEEHMDNPVFLAGAMVALIIAYRALNIATMQTNTKEMRLLIGMLIRVHNTVRKLEEQAA